MKLYSAGKSRSSAWCICCPLPGAPNYGGSMEEIWDAALADLEALTEGGITAAIVENFGDVPYTGAIEP